MLKRSEESSCETLLFHEPEISLLRVCYGEKTEKTNFTTKEVQLLVKYYCYFKIYESWNMSR